MGRTTDAEKNATHHGRRKMGRTTDAEKMGRATDAEKMGRTTDAEKCSVGQKPAHEKNFATLFCPFLVACSSKMTIYSAPIDVPGGVNRVGGSRKNIQRPILGVSFFGRSEAIFFVHNTAVL